MTLGAGIGLRAAHYESVLAQRPPVGWLEVHAENYFGEGGPHWHFLESVRRYYPVSVHGVGLSLGSTDELSAAHLQRVKAVVKRLEPVFVSEHLSWSSVGGRHLNQFLPLPYTEETLRHVAARVARVQEALGRELLVENPSRYLDFKHSTISEPEFMGELARLSGCRLLIDVTNVYISATNLGWDAERYLEAVPADLIAEVHLAGFTPRRIEGARVLLDSHDRPVPATVWRLYRRLVERIGPVPTLIEWDAHLPPLGELVQEAARAEAILERSLALPA